MGSGELTATMVQVHKDLLAAVPDPPRAVFLDTPAGFELNVKEISQRAIEYFRRHVEHSMSVASFKSKDIIPYEAEQAFHTLREADFILIGPGSPTYALHQWKQTPIPEIIVRRIQAGGCLVAASAAALTVGRFTLPVYEIYKVGQEPHWAEGLDILGHFDFDLVVVPHWNNAEGGTHDTRFCFMGEPRLTQLESLLPKEVNILGLDEHTAFLIDLEKEEAEIRGIGRVTLRRRGAEVTFEKGDRLPLDVLRKGHAGKEWTPATAEPTDRQRAPETPEESFWDRIHAIEASFRMGLDEDDQTRVTNALLELDRTIWQAQQDLESEEFISQAREILRDLIVLLGVRLESSPRDEVDCLAPLVEELLQLREEWRKKRQWGEADAIRETMQRANIIIEDTAEGPRWRLK